MAKIVAGVATSHVPAIGVAIDNKRTHEPYWAPVFQGYEPSKKWIAHVNPDVVIPMHCSGTNFLQAMREQMPDRLALSTTGSIFTLGA